jgi:hypothetical protein
MEKAIWLLLCLCALVALSWIAARLYRFVFWLCRTAWKVHKFRVELDRGVREAITTQLKKEGLDDNAIAKKLKECEL